MFDVPFAPPPSQTTTLSNLMFEIACGRCLRPACPGVRASAAGTRPAAPPHASMICFKPSPFLARISYWPRASASSLAKIVAACGLRLELRLLGRGLGLDDHLGLLGLGRGFERGPLLGLDPLGLGERGLGHRPVLRFLHRGLGLALLRLGELVRLGLASPRASAWASATFAWASASPATALALASASRTRLSRSASAIRDSRSNAACCSPTFWSRSSSAMRIACCRCDSLMSASCSSSAVCSPTFWSLSSWATRTACSRVASRVPISRSLVALAT